jgi:hypothetical protein
MSADPDRPHSRRELFTGALPRGPANLASGLLRARAELADLYDPGAAQRQEQNRQIEEILERNRREHPEWYGDLADEPLTLPRSP